MCPSCKLCWFRAIMGLQQGPGPYRRPIFWASYVPSHHSQDQDSSQPGKYILKVNSKLVNLKMTMRHLGRASPTSTYPWLGPMPGACLSVRRGFWCAADSPSRVLRAGAWADYGDVSFTTISSLTSLLLTEITTERSDGRRRS